MDTLRSLFMENYEISEKKIIFENRIIENKYLEIRDKTYTLLQVLFYVKHWHLPFHKYAKLCSESDIPVVDAQLMYYLAEHVFPLENQKQTCFSLNYDCAFILRYVIKKTFVILVPSSYDSKINIYNCVGVFSTGSFRNPRLDNRNILINERRLKKTLEKCTVELIFLVKQRKEITSKVAAIFLDGSNWQVDTFIKTYAESGSDEANDADRPEDMFMMHKKWECPIYFVHDSSTSISNTTYDFIDVNVDDTHTSKKVVDKIWSNIEEYIKRVMD